jgi:hypothetical protein
VFREALAIERDLASQNPAVFLPRLAVADGSLGNVYAATKRFDDAERAYNEALAIQRDLSTQNAAAFRPDLATTLHNLLGIYVETHRPAKAEIIENELSKMGMF